MTYKHIATTEKQEEMREEAAEKDTNGDIDAVLERYLTPDEVLGIIVIHHPYGRGTPMCEVTDVDEDEGTVTLSRLFDPETTYTVGIDESLDTPFIGQEYNVEWIEARIDGEWERVSDVCGNGQWRGPSADDEYENVRVVEKTYKHGADKYDEWPLRVDHQSGEADCVIDREDIQNPEALDTVLNQIELPDDFDVNGLQVGEIYTDTHIVEDEDGQQYKEFEIVWYSVRSQFRPSVRRYTTAVNGVERRSV